MSFEKKTLLHTVRRALSLCALLTRFHKETAYKEQGKKPAPCVPFVIIGSTIILLSANTGKPLPATREKKGRG
jgi:hypothetical protein